MRVKWQTAQESENKGFNLYRGSSPAGPFEKLNGGLIPSGSVSREGRDYEFVDTAVSRGAIYYYQLEDVDVSGAVTVHGPICVDWDGDGLPDDWELAHGLNSGVNDANLDSDGDGVPNLAGVSSGAPTRSTRTATATECWTVRSRRTRGTRAESAASSADASVQVIASDSRGDDPRACDEEL